MKVDEEIAVVIVGHYRHGKTTFRNHIFKALNIGPKSENGCVSALEAQLTGAQPELSRVSLLETSYQSKFLEEKTVKDFSPELAILLVAADQGVLQQTRECIEFLDSLTIKFGFSVISKIDLVDDETVELAESEIKEATAGSFLSVKPIIPFSGFSDIGTEKVNNALETEIKSLNKLCKRKKNEQRALKFQLVEIVTRSLASDPFKIDVTVDELQSSLGKTITEQILIRTLEELESETSY